MNNLVRRNISPDSQQLVCVYGAGYAWHMLNDVASCLSVSVTELCWISLHIALQKVSNVSRDTRDESVASWIETNSFGWLLNTSESTNFTMAINNIDFVADIVSEVLRKTIDFSRYEWVIADKVYVNDADIYFVMAAMETRQ